MVAVSAINVHFSRPPIRNAKHSTTRGAILEEENVFRLEIVMPCSLSHFGNGSLKNSIGCWYLFA